MKESEKKVLEVFFDEPIGKFYIREIAGLTGLNPNTVITSTQMLEKLGLIKREKRKHVVEFSADVNEKFRQLKRVSNLEKIYSSGILELLISKFNPEAISVIGSYSSGQDLKKSDIDMIVISKKKHEKFSLADFEKKIGRKIHIILIDYNKISEEFYANLINGIILYGFIRKK
jgi:predicted nucleotidyltransferase